MSDQARDTGGRFAGGSEAETRNAGRHPVAPHDDKQSVGTHVSGKAVAAGLLGALAGTLYKIGSHK